MIKIPTKYVVDSTSKFNRDLKKVIKQGKNIEKLIDTVKILANGETLDSKYKNHLLNNSKYYKDCYECHIEPDWLLVYKYEDKDLILLLCATGSHSNLF